MSEIKLPKRGKDTLWKLFLSTLYISAFTFGGGYVMITFMKKKYVDELHWIDHEEMLDLTAIAQSSPGVIAVNTSIMVGLKVAGFIGMLVAILGTILPPMLIIIVISFFYNAFASNEYIAVLLNGMQAGVAAVIVDVVYNLSLKVVKEKSILNICIMMIAFITTYIFNINVILIILGAAIIGIIKSLWNKKAVKS